MKRFIIITGCLMAMSHCFAQVVVNLQLPAAGLTLKNQLWNMSVINTGQDINAQVEMTITDASNNQRVLTAVSRIFALPHGAKQVQLNDVMPVVYTPGVSGYAVTADPDGFLPVGVFHVCYAITRYDNDRTEQLSEDCETIEVEPVSPPQLTMPAQNEYTETARPFFSWLPPSPVNLFSNVLYDWILVEVQPMQSPADAIQQNIPVLTQQNVAYANMQYPLSGQELDTGRQYAWRVTAKNNNTAMAVSDVWTFRVKTPAAEPVIKEKTGPYSRLRPAPDGAYVVSTGIVWAEFRNELANSMAEVHIYDISHPARREVPLDSNTCALRYGQNFLKFDLRGNSYLSDGHMYLLELKNAAGVKGYLKFEYRRQKGE